MIQQYSEILVYNLTALASAGLQKTLYELIAALGAVPKHTVIAFHVLPAATLDLYFKEVAEAAPKAAVDGGAAKSVGTAGLYMDLAEPLKRVMVRANANATCDFQLIVFMSPSRN